MKTRIETLENVVQALAGFDIKSEIIENELIKKGEPVVSIQNTDYFITVKEKKNSPNIYFLYVYKEHEKVKSKWLLGSTDILDIIVKCYNIINSRKMKNN